jgi:hypothetical protein
VGAERGGMQRGLVLIGTWRRVLRRMEWERDGMGRRERERNIVVGRLVGR